MKYHLTVRQEAESDLSAAFEYYESRRLGLGHDFLLCVEESFAKIERHPLSYKTIYKELRRIKIQRSPYHIFYRVQQESVMVMAVFHAR